MDVIQIKRGPTGWLVKGIPADPFEWLPLPLTVEASEATVRIHVSDRYPEANIVVER